MGSLPPPPSTAKPTAQLSGERSTPELTVPSCNGRREKDGSQAIRGAKWHAAFLLPSLSSFPDKTVLLRFRELYSSYQACFSVVSRMRRRKGPQQTKNQGQGSRAGILRRLEEKGASTVRWNDVWRRNQEDTPVDIILGFYVCPTSTFLECPRRI